MAKRLFIDLEKWNECPECEVKCSYFYHPANNGVATLRELATYAVVCRKCEEGVCVQSCPTEALEKEKDQPLKRYTMRCISCKSCTLACPFGTIYPDVVPYIVGACDYCLDRLAGNELPLCVKSCTCEGALKYEEVKEDKEKEIYFVGDNLAVHSVHWTRDFNVKKK